jgi:integrase
LSVARAKLKQLDQVPANSPLLTRNWLDATLAELADEFLADTKARKQPTTYTSLRYRLLRALKVLGLELLVRDVRKMHLAQLERQLVKGYSPTTVRDTLAAVQAVIAWAVRQDLLEINRLVGYEKPRGRSRTRVLSDEEFRTLLRHSDPAFRRFLLALRLTGCRPGELRNLRWSAVDLHRGLWIIQDHKTITRQRDPMPRVVPLCRPVVLLCRWLLVRNTAGGECVFLNARGRPYAKDCLVRKMERIRLRAGIQACAGERIVLYSLRHTFGTEATGQVSDIELAELMGHTDTRTTRRYVHLNPDRLHEIRRRVQRRSQVRENA